MSGTTSHSAKLNLRQRSSIVRPTSKPTPHRDPQSSPHPSYASHSPVGQFTSGSATTSATLLASQQAIPSPVSLDNALLQLTARDRATIQSYILPNTSDVDLALIQSLAAIKHKQQSYREKRKFLFAGREIDVKKEADKVIRWLDRFKSVGDVAVNANAICAALPWAGIRLLVEAAVSDANQMAALLIGCENALYMAHRLKAYTNFLDGLPSTLPRTNFEAGLTKLYALILQFLAHAVQIYETHVVKRALKAFWEIGDVQIFEEECDKLGRDLEIEASNCDRMLAEQNRNIIGQLKQNLQTALDELKKIHAVQKSLHRIETKISLNRLPFAKRATFNSYGQDHTICHPGTRTNVLSKIYDWVQCYDGEPIFWVAGMAGIGKSTISRTFAEWLSDQADRGDISLGASFFFKRGEGDRGNVSRFFPTIVRDLILQVPGLDSIIAEVMDLYPTICDKGIGDQFDKLIFQPLQKVVLPPHYPALVVVVDALDECDKESDVQLLLALWSRINEIKNVRLKLFLTSRPELPVRLGFRNMDEDIHRVLILHDEAEVPRAIIQQDILAFLTAKLSQIRKDYDGGRPLDLDWPGDTVLETLVNKAVPLFIIATTIYRYINDSNFDAVERLGEILQSRKIGQLNQMEQTYSTILTNLTLTLSEPRDKDRLYKNFRTIVGSIVLLAEPLSVSFLADLLNVERHKISSCLLPLYSVLRVPADHHVPVQTLHLSFREFLTYEEPVVRNADSYFVNSPATHQMLLTKCLDLLSANLRENMCNLSYPGQPRRELEPATIGEKIPPSLQYASQHWVYHAEQSHIAINDDDQVHGFLKKHLLHWLEVLSLMGRLSEVFGHISVLQSLLSMNHATSFSLLLEDALKIIRANRQVIDTAPLQVYLSAMIFAPEQSIVKKVLGRVPAWLRSYLTTPLRWGLELHKLEGHQRWVNAVAFSPDGTVLASASMDKTIKLWDSITGQELQTLTGHNGFVDAVSFSPDGTLLASSSRDGAIKLWDYTTARELKTLRGHTENVSTVAFSPDGAVLASGSSLPHHTVADNTVRLWNVVTGQEVQRLEGHHAGVNAVAFSPTADLLASASNDRTVKLWSSITGQELRAFDYEVEVSAVAFSPDGKLLAVALNKPFCTVRLWDFTTEQYLQILQGHTAQVNAVAFSPNGDILASCSDDVTIRLWRTVTGQEVQILSGHTHYVKAVAFAPDKDLLASASVDRTIRLWNPTIAQNLPKSQVYADLISKVALSPNGTLMAWGLWNGRIRLWDFAIGQELRMLEGHIASIFDMVFSPDGRLLVSASIASTIKVWDCVAGHELKSYEARSDELSTHIAFSPDSALVAVSVREYGIKLWNCTSRPILHLLLEHQYPVFTSAFSPDSLLLATASTMNKISIWKVATGQELESFEIGSNLIMSLAFSPDGALLAIVSRGYGITLWDIRTHQNLRQLRYRAGHRDLFSFSLDSTFLAMTAKPDGFVDLWNIASGQKLRTLEGCQYITTIAFAADNSALRTDRGVLPIGNKAYDDSVSDSAANQTLLLKDDWIQQNGRNLLWLPHEYRRAQIVFSENTFAFGLNSGLICFLRFCI